MKVYVIEKTVYQKNGEVLRYIDQVVKSRENASAYIEYKKILEKNKTEYINYWVTEETVSENNYKNVLEVMKLLESKD